VITSRAIDPVPEGAALERKRYRAVVTQASEGIFLVDADTKHFLEANAAFQNLLGYNQVLRLTYDVVVRTVKGLIISISERKDTA